MAGETDIDISQLHTQLNTAYRLGAGATVLQCPKGGEMALASAVRSAGRLLYARTGARVSVVTARGSVYVRYIRPAGVTP